MTAATAVAGHPDIAAHAPEARRALAALTRAAAGLDHRVSELVKTRVSQVNGCAYCVDLHATALRDDGEDPRRLDALAVWRDSPLFTPGERAALGLAEALTRLPGGAPGPDAYDAAREHWSEADVALIALVAVSINAWNRFMIATGAQVPPLGG